MSNESNYQKCEQRFKRVKWFEEMLCIMLVLLTLAICTIAFSTAVKIGNLDRFPNGTDSGFVAVTVALFGILITGVFVFMTFRIDRGAAIEARLTAEREAEQVLARVEAKLSNDIDISKGQMLKDAKENSEKFAVNIANQLRSRTIKVLLGMSPGADVNIPPLAQKDGKEP